MNIINLLEDFYALPTLPLFSLKAPVTPPILVVYSTTLLDRDVLRPYGDLRKLLNGPPVGVPRFFDFLVAELVSLRMPAPAPRRTLVLVSGLPAAFRTGLA